MTLPQWKAIGNGLRARSHCLVWYGQLTSLHTLCFLISVSSDEGASAWATTQQVSGHDGERHTSRGRQFAERRLLDAQDVEGLKGRCVEVALGPELDFVHLGCSAANVEPGLDSLHAILRANRSAGVACAQVDADLLMCLNVATGQEGSVGRGPF